MADQTKPRCYDCAFFKDDAAFPRCWHDRLVMWDPVFGNQPADARKQRGRDGICGPEGTLFERQQPSELEKVVGSLINSIFDGLHKMRTGRRDHGSPQA